MIDVLVVDDDFHVAEINAAYVSQVSGFRVTGRAHTAAQTLATLERTPPIWYCSTTTCPTKRAWHWCHDSANSATAPT